MGLRELFILVLILAIVGVILRGLYVALKARRGQLRMVLEKNIPQYDPDERSLSELPNGGARMVERSFADVVRQNSEFSSRDRLHKGRSEHAIPVLMDTVRSDYDDDGVGAMRSSTSVVAGARQAACQKHAARPPQKPMHRPIDRMPERQQGVAGSGSPIAAAVAAAGTTAFGAPSSQEPAVVEEQPVSQHSPYEEQSPVSETAYLDPLDRRVFGADVNAESDFIDSGEDDVDEPRYDAPAFESPVLAAAVVDEDDDFDQEIDEEYDAESLGSIYTDEDMHDDADEASDDPLAERFEDDLDEEFDNDSEDPDDLNDDDEYHYETDFGSQNDAEDGGYDDDEEDAVVEQKSGPRRLLQWAGEKLSGMTAAAVIAGERDRKRAVEQQAQARAERNENAAKTDHKTRTERAEPVFGAGSYDDALLNEQFQDNRPFAAAAPAPAEPRKVEPLDRSRQNELNLGEPEEQPVRQEPSTTVEEQTRKEPSTVVPAESRSPVKASPSKVEKPVKVQQPDTDAVPEYNEVLAINVVAKPDREFSGVDLLPVLLTCGLRFGDMSIFHRHLDADTRSPVLFSVANIVNPGTFDLNQISAFSTRGLCFFMTLPNVANSMQAFDKMLEVAQQVRIALDGDLKDDNRSVMTAQTIEHYRQRVRDFDLRQLRQQK